MDRICNPYSFAYGLSTSRRVNNLDQHNRASIKYETDQSAIRFKKGSQRWVASPRSGSIKLLQSFGYNESVFIKADSKRFEATAAEIRQGNYVAATLAVITTLNQIFETTKFNALERLRNANGRGRVATYFYVIKDNQNRYSEKRFSSGELAMIRLVERLNNIARKSLVLLDEAEMALHPRIQKNLLEYIQKKATEKELTIFISTHSTTLIKATSKKNIVLLQTLLNGNSEIVYPCYPAKAIGSVDFEECSTYDYIFFVEDDMASVLLKKMIKKFITLDPTHLTISICVTPVGGYEQTAQLAVNTKLKLFDGSTVYAVLDEDAFVEGQNNTTFWSLYQSNRDTIKNLYCTPELWIIQQLESENARIHSLLREEFRCECRTILRDTEYQACTGVNPRKLAKKRFDIVVAILKSRSGMQENLIIDKLVELLIDNLDDGKIRRVIAPLLR